MFNAFKCKNTEYNENEIILQKLKHKQCG